MFDKKRYVETFSAIGESIGKTSEKFGEVGRKENNSLDDLKKRKQEYIELLKEYQSQYKTLKHLEVSSVIEDEHKGVLDALRQFIQSVEKQVQAINLDSGKIDKELINSAVSDNHIAVTKIERVVPKLGSKLSLL